jgi:nucleotide-binding universal stress UspA family protein
MGAHGHSRLREWLLGSTMHAILDASEIPVLLQH